MLKGQAKKHFEKWLKGSYNGYSVDFYLSLPKAFQYGVIVDWFDSMGIQIEIIISNSNYAIQIFKVNNNYPMYSVGEWETRTQARQKAIEQANTIYNDRK